MFKVISKIYGMGRGWVFTQKDFGALATRNVIDVSLNRLLKQGSIRRLMRGIYDYPIKSTLFDGYAAPEPEQIARAIARKHVWRIQPIGDTALNLLRLSTQVVAKHVYLSDGPSRIFTWENGSIEFRHAPQKEMGSLSFKSALVVQALRALGPRHLTEQVRQRLQKDLSPREKQRLLREARYVSGWVYEEIRKICFG